MIQSNNVYEFMKLKEMMLKIIGSICLSPHRHMACHRPQATQATSLPPAMSHSHHGSNAPAPQRHKHRNGTKGGEERECDPGPPISRQVPWRRGRRTSQLFEKFPVVNCSAFGGKEHEGLRKVPKVRHNSEFLPAWSGKFHPNLK